MARLRDDAPPARASVGAMTLTRKQAYRKAYYAANKQREIEANKAASKKYRESHRSEIRFRKSVDVRVNLSRAIWRRAEYRAKRDGIDFDITPEDVVVPDCCPVLGIKLFVADKKGYSPNSPSLDRVDNSKGYVKGNVVVISARANALKRDASLGEVLAVYEYMLNEIASR